MNNASTKMYSKIAYLSSIIMIIGIHLPVYLVSDGSQVVLVSRINNEGILLLISALLVIVQKYVKRDKFMIVPLVFDVGIIVYYVLLIRKQENFLTVSWGFVCIIFAIVLLLFALCTRKVVNNEFMHDISSMKIIETDDYDYSDDVKFKDYSWIITIIILTTIFVMFKLNMDKRSSEVSASEIASKRVSASENDNISSTECDYENDMYCVSVVDGYITNEDGEEIVFIEISLKNKTKSPLVFNELFEINVKQGEKELTRCTKVDSDIFDSNSSLAQISLFETSKIYIPFILLDSQKNIKVSLRTVSASDSIGESIVEGKLVKINDLYYVDTLEEIIHIGERKMEAEDKAENKNDDNDDVGNGTVEPTLEATVDTTTLEPIQTTHNNETESTEETSSTPEVTGASEPEKKIISGTVKFIKPELWDESVKVYLNLYKKEDDVVEEARVINSGYDNGEYTFLLKDVDMTDKVYITFGNDSQIYPTNNKKLELVMGKKYTSN